jgi:nascent polypeptide-associated complex subunit alpha
MMPKMNPRKMKKMMRQMGMESEELDATEVIFKLRDGELVIKNPNVTVITAMGQKTYQVTGEEKTKAAIPEDDVKLVSMQANVSEDEARSALEETDGDLAEAIVLLGKEG